MKAEVDEPHRRSQRNARKRDAVEALNEWRILYGHCSAGKQQRAAKHRNYNERTLQERGRNCAGGGDFVEDLHDRRAHARGVGDGAGGEDGRKHADVKAIGERADARTPRRARERCARNNSDDADVLMRTRRNAIEAEGAIEVAVLLRHEEPEAAARKRWRVGDGGRTTLEAIMGFAARANIRIERAHFAGRDRRQQHLILPDWTNETAETRAFKEKIDGGGGNNEADQDERRCPRTRPEIEGFVRHQPRDDQRARDPLRTQRGRPCARRRNPAAKHRARRDEWTSHARGVCYGKNCHNGKAAPVRPRQSSREVHRCILRANDSVDGDERRQREHRKPQSEPHTRLAQQRADHGNAQQIARSFSCRRALQHWQ